MAYLQISDVELAVLDGKCSEETQKIVDAAKARLGSISANPGVPEPVASLAADLVLLAKSTGKLQLQHRHLSRCRVCSKYGGYAKYTRSGRYHRKGDINYDKPTFLWGVDLEVSMVTVKGHVTHGCCTTCWDQWKDFIGKQLLDVEAEVPQDITGVPSKYKWYSRAKCQRCGWEGHEGEMGRLRTLMGDGWYAGQCPQCKAENHLFSNEIKTVGLGWVVVPVGAPIGGA